MPEGIDIVTFVKHDRKPPDSGPVLPESSKKVFQMAKSHDLYLKTYGNGTIEAKTLETCRLQLTHLTNFLGERFPIGARSKSLHSQAMYFVGFQEPSETERAVMERLEGMSKIAQPFDRGLAGDTLWQLHSINYRNFGLSQIAEILCETPEISSISRRIEYLHGTRFSSNPLIQIR